MINLEIYNIYERTIGKILIISENITLLQDISIVLSKLTYKIAVANTVLGAVKYLNKKKPDIILIDFIANNNEYIDFINNIREDSTLINIPIIFFISINNLELRKTAFKLGAIDYIILPYEIEELDTKLFNHFKLIDNKKSQTKDTNPNS